MNGTKSWIQSRGVVGAVVVMILGVLQLLGIAADEALRAELEAWLTSAGCVVFGAVSLWGRLKANKRIGSGGQVAGFLFGWWAVCAILGALAMSLGGCNADASPLTRTVQARQLYTGTLEVLTVARRDGLIDDETALEIEQGRQVAAAALDRLELEALQDDRLGWDSAYRVFDAAMRALIEQRLKVEKEGQPTPAGLPVLSILGMLVALAKLAERLNREGRSEATPEELEAARIEQGIVEAEWKSLLPPRP